MQPERFAQLTGKYRALKLAVLGDFCLDRYLEIDAAHQEVSLETGLRVHKVISVRAQPGGAGTILNNLSALGVGEVYPVGFAGDDGEGFELYRALERGLPGTHLNHFIRTDQRRTFTYCKPLLVEAGKPPVELNRLDIKNHTPTPGALQRLVLKHLEQLESVVDGIVVLDQVDLPESGVVTSRVLHYLNGLAKRRPELLVLADSRRGLQNYPPLAFKMNRAELERTCNRTGGAAIREVKTAAARLARINGQPVFITLAEKGIVGALPSGEVQHVAAFPVTGPIDIVGAGDAVSANVVAALVAGGTLLEALQLASAAACVVIHKLGTTGTANLTEIREVLAAHRRCTNKKRRELSAFAFPHATQRLKAARQQR